MEIRGLQQLCYFVPGKHLNPILKQLPRSFLQIRMTPKALKSKPATRFGAFRVTGGVTYTNASIANAADASVIGKHLADRQNSSTRFRLPTHWVMQYSVQV
jgi:hypothetical protein